jgi:hypothetical protein
MFSKDVCVSQLFLTASLSPPTQAPIAHTFNLHLLYCVVDLGSGCPVMMASSPAPKLNNPGTSIGRIILPVLPAASAMKFVSEAHK